jgi:hypothetical protein
MAVPRHRNYTSVEGALSEIGTNKHRDTHAPFTTIDQKDDVFAQHNVNLKSPDLIREFQRENRGTPDAAPAEG